MYTLARVLEEEFNAFAKDFYGDECAGYLYDHADLLRQLIMKFVDKRYEE